MVDAVVGLRFDVYPSSISDSDVLTALGGDEEYNDYANRLVHTYNAPETIQDIIMKVITKYINEDYALSWFDRVDNELVKNQPAPDKLDAYALMPPFTDAYYEIEKRYYDKNKTELEPKLEILKKQFSESSTASLDMKNANDNDWIDSLILNLDTPGMLGTRWDSGRDEQAAQEWHDTIDDLMLLYAATTIYIGVRAFGSVSVYALNTLSD